MAPIYRRGYRILLLTYSARTHTCTHTDTINNIRANAFACLYAPMKAEIHDSHAGDVVFKLPPYLIPLTLPSLALPLFFSNFFLPVSSTNKDLLLHVSLSASPAV